MNKSFSFKFWMHEGFSAFLCVFFLFIFGIERCELFISKERCIASKGARVSFGFYSTLAPTQLSHTEQNIKMRNKSAFFRKKSTMRI
jgi:hypothetical protein